MFGDDVLRLRDVPTPMSAGARFGDGPMGIDSQRVFQAIAFAFQLAGAAAMVIGICVALVVAVTTWRRTRSGARGFTALRETIGGVILLGLEILVAADLIRTVTSTPSLSDAVVLALIVLIRTGLSFSLQVEIDGVAPWRRALVTGPQAMRRAVGRAKEPGSALGRGRPAGSAPSEQPDA
jgi:uncharacterized membrane protein